MIDTTFRFCMHARAVLLAVALSSALNAPVSAADPHETLYETQYQGLAMGTLITARLISPDDKAVQKLDDFLSDRIDAYETLFTVHREGPLYEVNKRSGQWVDVDCRIAELTEKAKTIAEASDRAFEPTIGTLVNVWKIGFGGNQVPERRDIEAALEKVDYTKIETKRENNVCRMRIGKGQSIDLGAIAKGWIGTALTQDLKAVGATNVLLDLGGNVALLGKSPAGLPWNVGIQRPDKERGQIFAVVKAFDESVITSGAYERKIEKDGKSYGHILSPETGMPVATDIASVTIVDKDGARADGWCTALFAMGVEKAVKKMAEQKDLGVFILDADLKRAWVSKCIADRLKVQDPQVKLTIVE